jgi:hypothetical protein
LLFPKKGKFNSLLDRIIFLLSRLGNSLGNLLIKAAFFDRGPGQIQFFPGVFPSNWEFTHGGKIEDSVKWHPAKKVPRHRGCDFLV